jgi:hypothetical protein
MLVDVTRRVGIVADLSVTRGRRALELTQMTYFCEVLAHSLGGMTKVMAERTGIAGLTRALSEELARDV